VSIWVAFSRTGLSNFVNWAVAPRNENIPITHDDYYWRSFEAAMSRFAGFHDSMNKLDALSKRLTEEAFQEYLERDRRAAEDTGS
jgi:hypothetical protein